MSQTKSEQTRLVINIKTVWLAVRFNCKLSFVLKNDLNQVITNSDFTYPLTRGQAQVNDILTYTAPINTLVSQKFKVFVIMVSANGMVPAGFVAISIPNKQFGTSLPTTLPLERCQDMRAQIKLTVGLDDGTKNLLLSDQEGSSIGKERLSQIKRIGSPMNQLNYIYSPPNRSSNSTKKLYNLRYSKKNEGSAIKILKDQRSTENQESGNKQPLFSISKEQLVKQHQEFWVEIVKLQGQNEALKEEIKELKEKNQHIEGQVQASSLGNQQLRQQYQSLLSKFEQIRLQNSSLRNQNSNLCSQKASSLASNESLLTQRRNIISENESYRKQNSSLEAENQRLRVQNEKIYALVNQVQEGNQKNQKIQKQLKEQKRVNQRLDEQLRHIEEELEQAKLNIKTLIDLNSQLQQTSDLQKDNIQSTKSKLQTLQSQHHSVLERLEHSQKNISEVALQKQELLQQKNQIDQSIKLLKSQNEKTQQKILKSQKQIETLHLQKQQLLLTKCTLQIDNQTKEEQICKLVANIQSLLEQKQKNGKNQQQLQQELKQQQEKILQIQAKLQEQTKESSKTILQNKKQIEELIQSLSEAREKSKILQTSYEALQIDFLQITQKCKKTEQANGTQLALISQINKKYDGIEKQFELMNQLVMKEQEEKQKLLQSFSETQIILRQTNSDNGELIQKVNILEEQLNNLIQQLSQSKDLIKTTEEQRNSLQESLNKVEEKNAALLKEISSLKEQSSLNQSKLIIAEQQVEEAEAQLYTVRNYLSEIQSKQTHHKEYEQSYNQSMTELTLRQAKLQQQNTDLRKSLDQLSLQAAEAQEKFQTKQKEIAELKTFTHAKLQENLKLRKEKEQLSAKFEGK